MNTINRLAWLTDIHLNFIAPYKFDSFVSDIRQQQPDVVLLSGDIGEANNVVYYLQRLAKGLARPIYFVLGNHDFYRASIAEVTAAVRSSLCRIRQSDLAQ